MNLSDELDLKNNKYLIIHADDAGLCESQNEGIIRSIEEGLVNSYSIMMPTPKAKDIINYALNTKNDIDYGIHLTHTSEWKNYKWPPVGNKNKTRSLVDSDGNFNSTRGEFLKYAIVQETKYEAMEQINLATNYGLLPSHFDSHMYLMGLSPDLVLVYKEIGEHYRLPTLLNKRMIEYFGTDVNSCINEMDFCLDNIILGTSKHFERNELKDYYVNELNNLKAGITIMLVHPAVDSKEMRDITVDHPNFGSKWRQLDLDFLMSSELEDVITKNHIELISWRDIKNNFFL